MHAYNMQSDWSISALEDVGRVLYGRGLQDDSSEAPSFGASIRGSIRILERAGKLEILRLLLQFDFNLTDNCLKPLKLNHSTFDNLTVILVHLRKDRDDQPHISQTPICEKVNLPGNDYQLHWYEDPKAWATEKGWEYADVRYDHKGRFPVHDMSCAHCSNYQADGLDPVENLVMVIRHREQCETLNTICKWYNKAINK